MRKQWPYFEFQKRTKPVRWAWGIILLIVLPSLALGAESSPKSKKDGRGDASRQEPIRITADQMEVDRKKSTIMYRGNVVATQGEMTMRSETLTAVYNPDMKGLQTVVAEGKVHISQSDRTAVGSKAVFNGRDQTITLTGDPVINHGNSQISGSRIVFFMEEDRATVEGGKDRVRATVFPEDFDQKKQRETKKPKDS